jgi:ATP-dependent Lhr-like helicase
VRNASDPLAPFHPVVREWFSTTFGQPTRPQMLGWPAIARGESTLILSPTGSGKTLAAFLWCIDRLMFVEAPPRLQRCRVLYVSPLKALAVDVERNLQLPLTGIVQAAAARGERFVTPVVAVRSGDTPSADRMRFRREPADILITTPESLFLILTSQAREVLRSIDTVIVDEIHSLVTTKRGAHLALSLERLAAQRGRPLQRIGLSATQRPLDEIARFLGGVESVERREAGPARRLRPHASNQPGASIAGAREIETEFGEPAGRLRYRPVTIVDAGTKKALQLTIEVPVEDVARKPGPPGSSSSSGDAVSAPGAATHLSEPPDLQGESSTPRETGASIWSAIHPRLLELIRGHRSTLIFVNSRRLAERLAAALNELAGEPLVRSHHGSIAREQRLEVEELLKAGSLRALVATSSLELGIDMGTIDLVIQIEAPPSVASGLQRIGRSGHRANAVSEGVIVPKFRGDLVACAAVAKAMREGAVEATHYPRNPLDIVAQQIVAMVSMDEWEVDRLFATIRSAAPFAGLSRAVFDGVLDMLSGRYPSDEFAELRPRVTWDRASGRVVAREGARRVAIANGGTIPDRGLYGVFLFDAGRMASGAARVGELDEEMVFESRIGETFVLGASSWRIVEITHDRVLVVPAPGEPGKMPFWKGDRAGRPIELGLAIGRLIHDLLRVSPAAAVDRLITDHALDRRAAEMLLQYLRDQLAAASAVPDAATIVVERVRDELGDWRVCVLSPRGGRVHAPWAMAAAAKIREETGVDVETLWGDDGFVVRFPDVDRPPDTRLLLPDPEEAQALVVRQLGATALFAAKFRENAARSLLLPKRRPGMRAPLWQQRKRAADLLAVASRYGSFPVLLETYRECLRDYFDMPALVQTLTEVRSRKIRVTTVDATVPSPFAASLLYSYVASFLYDGDAPLAERRAQALAVNQNQLSELLADAELRDLLDAESMDAVERQLQRIDPRYAAKSADGVHDMLLAIGDLSKEELVGRVHDVGIEQVVDTLLHAHRIVAVPIAGEARYIAVEDAARYRDALGAPLPAGIPLPLLVPATEPITNLLLRYARTHAPFTAATCAARFGLSTPAAEAELARLAAEGRLLEGAFRPGGFEREWIDASVLRMLRRRSLAKLRHEIEPVDQTVLSRFATTWHGTLRKRRGADAILDAVEQLQGAPLPASILEQEILSGRIESYDPADLDAMAAAGEVGWVGLEPLGERDGRLALYLSDQAARLVPPSTEQREHEGREAAILEYLERAGASFFGPLHEAVGGGYPGETVASLWRLAWSSEITNDTFHVLRAFARLHSARHRRRRRKESAFRSRRLVPPSAEGRWAIVRRSSAVKDRRAATIWATSVTQQLLARHGVITRESLSAEAIPGGFAALYPVLTALEDAGRVRRGYFAQGLGAMQFALPGAADLLRSLRQASDEPELVVLAATDPANLYGAALHWPAGSACPALAGQAGRAPTRSVGANVILINGALAAYVTKGDRQVLTFLPESEPERTQASRLVSRALIERARCADAEGDSRRGALIEEIDGRPPAGHPLSAYLIEAGFVPGAMGFQGK